MLSIVRKAKARRVHLELSAHPDRVDLVDKHCRMAKDEGGLVAIDSNAHDTGELAQLRYGVGQARRAWLCPGDVLNARGWRGLLPLAERHHPRPRASRSKTRPPC